MASNPYKDIIKMLNKTAKAQTLGEQFVADLDRVFQVSKEIHVPSRTLKPSAIGGCMRMQWFMLRGEEQDPGRLESAEMVTIQQSGNDRHNRIQIACQRAHEFKIPIIWLDPEEEIAKANAMGINTIIKRRDGNELLCYNKDYNINFKCDGFILYRDIKMILEVKTEDTFKWQARVCAEDKHEFQAGSYCLCVGYNNVMFLYEDRNYTRRKAYHVHVDNTQIEIVKQRVLTVLDYNNKNICPPKEKDSCTYCSYKQACRKYN